MNEVVHVLIEIEAGNPDTVYVVGVYKSLEIAESEQSSSKYGFPTCEYYLFSCPVEK